MTHAPPIRVMVVDDSAVVRGFLSRIVEREPDMRVVAAAWHGRAALDVLRRKTVDVILLDIEMPEMDGLEALPLILEAHPEVRVLMASSLTRKGAHVAIKALSLGAADYVEKPKAGSGLEGISADLVRKVRALGNRLALGREASPAPNAPETARTRSWRGVPEIVAITSSTGGPHALRKLLSALPVDLPLPIVVVQHMPPLFTKMLAERLQSVTGRPCKEAEDGEPILGGTTYVAPGGFHLEIDRTAGGPVARLNQREQVNFCRPAADPLFESLSRVYGANVVAAVLTGMGHDGRDGCRAIQHAGGYVVAQDQETSVVWGMPGAVTAAGLADTVLPLDQIAGHIMARTGTRV